jgi:hypothetical protein
LKFELLKRNGEEYVQLHLKDACEFMSRKDYTDNWESEMHETFCFWDFEEWKRHLEDVGFSVSLQSKAYTNEWIVKNRLEGKAELFSDSDIPEKINFPVTNMLLLAIKN